MKYCTNSECQQLNPQLISSFHKRSSVKSGLSSWCKSCHSSYSKNHYSYIPNKIKRNEYGTKISYKFNKYMTNAKKRNLVFELFIDDFIFITGHNCMYCGKLGPNGIDRKDNDQGYTISNSVPCCTTCNRMKTNMSFDDMIDHFHKILRHMRI